MPNLRAWLLGGARRRARRPTSIACAFTLSALASCAEHARPAPNAASDVAAAPSASTVEVTRAGVGIDHAWKAIGCFVGAPWYALLGAPPEERAVAARAGCRDVAKLGRSFAADDPLAVSALAGLEPDAVDRVIATIERELGAARDKDRWVRLLRASADAARETMLVRRAAEQLKRDFNKEMMKSTDGWPATPDSLADKTALAALDTDDAKLVTLLLAADRLESLRGLPSSAKSFVAAPAFDVLFGQPLPPAARKLTPGAWLGYVRAAATAGGHPVSLPPSASTADLEKAAFAEVAHALADRLDALAPTLSGPPKTVALAYVRRLRDALAAADDRALAKRNAAATTDAAAKNAK